MVAYLTFNDAPSGVFRSQVIDVVEYLRGEGQPIRLVAFISLRGFKSQRNKIKEHDPRAFVIPMFPGVKNWRANIITLVLLFLVIRPKTVMARGVFAARLARKARSWLRYYRVVFDARGAYHAEFSEYRLVDDDRFIDRVQKLEQKAIRQSDAILAVSNALVQHWKEKYSFSRINKVQIVPCTMLRQHEQPLLPAAKRQELRKANGIAENDIVLAYAGSSAGWQSMGDLLAWLAEMMRHNPKIRVLLLTPLKSVFGTPIETFEDRVLLKWVSPGQVMEFLSIADYGLLLRQPSLTNRVASPTKFAEYLIAGLSVLISPDIGDFSAFTKENNCGLIVRPGEFPSLHTSGQEIRDQNHRLAMAHFTKPQYREAYSLLLS